MFLSVFERRRIIGWRNAQEWMWLELDRGAPRKTWRSCVKRDMKAMGIKEEIAQDRCAWRNITGGPTRASADAWNTVCFGVTDVYDDDDDDLDMMNMYLFSSCPSLLFLHSPSFFLSSLLSSSLSFFFVEFKQHDPYSCLLVNIFHIFWSLWFFFISENQNAYIVTAKQIYRFDGMYNLKDTRFKFSFSQIFWQYLFSVNYSPNFYLLVAWHPVKKFVVTFQLAFCKCEVCTVYTSRFSFTLSTSHTRAPCFKYNINHISWQQNICLHLIHTSNVFLSLEIHFHSGFNFRSFTLELWSWCQFGANHVLAPLIPPSKSHPYNLRNRRHNIQIRHPHTPIPTEIS